MYEQQPIQVHSLWIIDSQLTHTHTQAPTVCVCVSNSLHTFQVNENIFLHWVNKIINYLFHWRSPFSASLSLTGCVCLARMIIAYTRREIIRSLIFIQRVYLTIEMLYKIPLRQKCLLVDLPGALFFIHSSPSPSPSSDVIIFTSSPCQPSEFGSQKHNPGNE